MIEYDWALPVFHAYPGEIMLRQGARRDATSFIGFGAVEPRWSFFPASIHAGLNRYSKSRWGKLNGIGINKRCYSEFR